jgi:N-acetylated-alpha-linked acidic dipeptidase
MEAMAGEPHVAGQPSSKKVADYALAKFKSFGLDAKFEEFEAMMPWPIETTVEVVGPEKYTLRVKEPVLAEDPDSGDQTPLYNAYSGDGNVTGEVVYVNYGMPADYDKLKELGVDVKGKIVIARYGAGWRGIKPKVAYEHGAIGCLIYSDPRDDGYYAGDVYPGGPYRPEFGAQRGSVMDMPVHAGDPLTPGWGSEPGGKKNRIEDSQTILKIPVLPISYGDAAPILRQLKGQGRPERMEGRAAVHVSRWPRSGAGPHEPALRVEEPPAL